jgi:mono/diheme cytochrome c family protein
VDQEELLATEGVMPHTRWLNQEVGHDQVRIGGELFRAHCRPCHTWDGYNGLRPYLARWDPQTIASLVPRLEYLRGLMPPWFGDDYENLCMTQHLLEMGAKGDASFPSDPAKAERLAWDISCGLCHTVDGFRPLREAVTGQSAEELSELLDMVGDLLEEMPPYYGQGHQRELLIRFLVSIGGAPPETTQGKILTKFVATLPARSAP